jgi:clan AA aspartic protease
MSSVGIFNVRVTLRNPAHPEQERELELLVDTGSLFSWVPAPILREIGLLPVENRQFRTITGAMIERPIGHVIIAYNGRTGAMNVVFGEPDDMAVLGVTALESLSVTADPVRNTLVPTVSLAV